MRAWERRLAEVARRFGLVVEAGRGGHRRLVDPATGRRVIASTTPRCPDTALRNVVRDCRRLVGDAEGL